MTEKRLTSETDALLNHLRDIEVFYKYVSEPLAMSAVFATMLEYKYISQIAIINDFVDLTTTIQNDLLINVATGLPLTMTRQHFRAALMHAGNEHALLKLAQGYGARPAAVMDWFKRTATQNDWIFAQAYGKLWTDIKRRHQDPLYERQSGLPAEDFDNENKSDKGDVLDGWFYPIIYDKLFIDTLKQRPRNDDSMPYEPDYYQMTIPRSYQTKLINYVAPLNLNLYYTTIIMRRVLHTIAFLEVVQQAGKFVHDPSIQSAINTNLQFSSEVTKNIVPHLWRFTYSAMPNSVSKDIFGIRHSFVGAVLTRLLGGGAQTERRSKAFHANFTREDRLDWFAHTPPWDHVAPAIINSILDAITEKGLLEAFVSTSMKKGLVARYELLGRECSDAKVIRAQISQILCQSGNLALASFVKALDAQQMYAVGEIACSAVNLFESAIAFAEDQIVAYIGMAALYGLVGKGMVTGSLLGQSHDYAKRGLNELQKLRQTTAARALRESTISPADILDQLERQLRVHLEH